MTLTSPPTTFITTCAVFAACLWLTSTAAAQEVQDDTTPTTARPQIIDADLSATAPPPLSPTTPTTSTEEEKLSDKFLLRRTPQPIAAPGSMWLRDQGQPTTLENYRGKWVVLNLWATWCIPCVAEMPTLDKLHRRYNRAGLEVVAINVDGMTETPTGRQGLTPENIQSFYRQVGVRYLPVHIDPFDHLTLAFQVKRLPTSFLINPDGMIVGVLDGAEDWFSPNAQAVIQRALTSTQGKTPTPKVKDIFAN